MTCLNGLLAFQFASPGPVLFELGPLSIRWYGFLIASAVLLGVTLAQFLAPKRGLNPDLIGDFAIWGLLGAIPMARLYYVLFQWQAYADRPAQVFAIWRGGIAIHGAIIGGVLAGVLFARRQRISFWQLFDIITPSIILGQAIGRWGNFFNSEAFGRPTDLPWKLYIPQAMRPAQYMQEAYFHPTFLYESLWNLLIFALLLWLFFQGQRGKLLLKPGTLFLSYAIAYSLGRLAIEGLRIDSLMLGPVRVAQLVSFGGILLGVVGLLWLYVLGRSLPDVIAENESRAS
ncbi:prolipoprotein diacylglyceryl transferase [Sodalinema gerasimenkoae]|uniref:prolipoprotein diacylglyceryl transferase n=1 Tax=Sodalinema gerasimenkoae TaxID=2862348 RepID=UPI00135C73EB|nr:prolipoprotein diacylglyceryl transferase [Sodalinema gerasimenkoae]